MNIISESTKIATDAINEAAVVNQVETKKIADAQPQQNGSKKASLQLPVELIRYAFSFLRFPELGDCRQLSKQCKALVTNENFLSRTYAERTFGKKRWQRNFGDIGEEPALPKNIHSILQAACPIWGGKKVIETHMLVLIPRRIDKHSLTLKSLGEFVKEPKQGYPTCYEEIFHMIVRDFGDQSVDKTHWVLMTTDLLPGSYHKSYADQCALVAGCSQKAQAEYQLPKTLEAAVCIFTKYCSSGKRLFSKESLTTERCKEQIGPDAHYCGDLHVQYTRCQEQIDGSPLVIGDFGAGGLNVHSHFGDAYNGVAVLRKL